MNSANIQNKNKNQQHSFFSSPKICCIQIFCSTLNQLYYFNPYNKSTVDLIFIRTGMFDLYNKSTTWLEQEWSDSVTPLCPYSIALVACTFLLSLHTWEISRDTTRDQDISTTSSEYIIRWTVSGMSVGWTCLRKRSGSSSWSRSSYSSRYWRTVTSQKCLELWFK